MPLVKRKRGNVEASNARATRSNSSGRRGRLRLKNPWASLKPKPKPKKKKKTVVEEEEWVENPPDEVAEKPQEKKKE